MPLTDEDQKKYRALYIQTAKPYLADLQKIATFQPDDKDTIEVIHRAAHSLGSQSLMMEFNSLGSLSRHIEKVFKMTMDGEYTINRETKEALLHAVSRMKDSVDAIEKGDAEFDLTPDIASLQKISHVTV